jgi:uncharacterized Rossmann fold enzyme
MTPEEKHILEVQAKLNRIVSDRIKARKPLVDKRAEWVNNQSRVRPQTKKEAIKAHAQINPISTIKPCQPHFNNNSKSLDKIPMVENNQIIETYSTESEIKLKRWEGETVCVIASGPSLTVEDCNEVKRRAWKTIAINDSYKIAPFSDVLYACDGSWWDVHVHEVKKNFINELWTQDKHAAKAYNLNYIKSENKQGLSLKDVIYQGANSGYQCTNLAYLWGAKRIILLGLDCSPDKNGKTHWFGKHPRPLSNTHPFERWKTAFNKIAEDLKKVNIEVINASRRTALTCFPNIYLENIE